MEKERKAQEEKIKKEQLVQARLEADQKRQEVIERKRLEQAKIERAKLDEEIRQKEQMLQQSKLPGKKGAISLTAASKTHPAPKPIEADPLIEQIEQTQSDIIRITHELENLIPTKPVDKKLQKTWKSDVKTKKKQLKTLNKSLKKLNKAKMKRKK